MGGTEDYYSEAALRQRALDLAIGHHQRPDLVDDPAKVLSTANLFLSFLRPPPKLEAVA